VQNYTLINKRKKLLPLSLVLAPTRELALQIYEEARKVKKNFIRIYCAKLKAILTIFSIFSLRIDHV